MGVEVYIWLIGIVVSIILLCGYQWWTGYFSVEDSDDPFVYILILGVVIMVWPIILAAGAVCGVGWCIMKGFDYLGTHGRKRDW